MRRAALGPGLVARRRPTLPPLVRQYHGRWGVSRPSSGWDRVWPPRDGHRATGPGPGRVSIGDGWLACGALCGCGSVLRAVPGDPPRGGPSGARRGGWEFIRAIRTARLSGSPHVYLRPIDVVVFHGPRGRPGLEGGFPLRCLQRLSRPHLATRRCGWRHNRCTRGASVPVLSYWGRILSGLLRPRQIGTELSHDVLNPAHVPL